MDTCQGQDGPDELNAPPSAGRPVSLARRALQMAPQLALVAGILGYLIHTGKLDLGALGGLRHRWIWIVYAILCVLPQYFLCAFRYRLLLGALQLPGTLGQAFSWSMIGSFFDLAMPLSNGGDLVKAYYVARHAGRGRRGLAVLSVVLDRVVGLLALFVFAWLVCLFAGRQVDDNPQLLRLSRALLFVCAGSLVAFCVLVSPPLERSALRRRLLHWAPYHAKLEALYVAFAGLRRQWVLLLGMLGLSLIVQILGCAAILFLAKGLPFTNIHTGAPAELELVPTLVVLPLAVFLNTFGVAGGFGMGEAAFQVLFWQLLNVDGGANLALAFHCLFALLRLLGIPFVVFYRHKEHAPPGRIAAEVAETLAEEGSGG
ncbi:MAG: lysylphosphatidylglycerol synthase transmembrane domain-containing protein [Planctomycetota bacterium]